MASVADESVCVFGVMDEDECVCESEFIAGARCNIRLEQKGPLESCLYVYDDEDTKEEAECIVLVPFECDEEFAVAISATSNGLTQMLATDVVSGSDSELELCSDPVSGRCTACFTFSDINMQGNVVTANVTQTADCENVDDLDVTIALGPLEHTGALCGDDDYFYLPCGFTPPKSPGEVEEEIKRSLEDEEEPFLFGNDHCIFFSEAPRVPLICPVVVMATCSGTAYEVSYGGVPIFFELEEGKDDSQCKEGTVGLVCIDVREVAVGSTTVSYESTVTLTLDSEEVYTFQLPKFSEGFPECGEGQETCGNSGINASGSNASGSNASGSVDEDSSEEGNGDDDNDDDDGLGALLWLIAIPVAFCALLLFASMVVLGLVLMYKRRNRTLTLSDAGLEMDVEELGDD